VAFVCSLCVVLVAVVVCWIVHAACPCCPARRRFAVEFAVTAAVVCVVLQRVSHEWVSGGRGLPGVECVGDAPKEALAA